ncbi:hypothetical protein MIPYR_70088 [uncultured Microbacterium sp.]|uniref:Uncharacterized protein n=1 Tax=uncultured Microbacterium sp. TaxID=191216 RepID=A0A1Y5PFP4_9MICO|nr:hypothetical protein MIPYR_70088 [uncultured Microbacterium sp.]
MAVRQRGARPRRGCAGPRRPVAAPAHLRRRGIAQPRHRRERLPVRERLRAARRRLTPRIPGLLQIGKGPVKTLRPRRAIRRVASWRLQRTRLRRERRTSTSAAVSPSS